MADSLPSTAPAPLVPSLPLAVKPSTRPPGKRHRLASVLNKVGAVSTIRRLRRSTSHGVPILGYHRVIDIPDEDAYPYDVELVSCGVPAFTQQMRHLREHWNPISLTRLISDLDAGRAPPPGAVVVTFDDGFSDCYENAFPVLRKLEIPATVFIATQYIDDQRTMWYEQLSHALLSSPMQQLDLEGVGLIPLRSAIERRAAVKKLLRWMKRLPNSSRLASLARIQAQMQVDGARRDSRSAPITWDQVREMSAAGIEFGSHSVTHPVLSMVDTDSLLYEVGESKRRIEEILGTPVLSFAYPDGSEDAFNAAVREAVRISGYRCGMSYMSGVDSIRKWNPYAVRRLNIDRFVDADMFSATLAIPEIFSY